jgi:hypothetical protein
MYLKLVCLVLSIFVPLPLYPRVKRPDPTKNFWTFECEGFSSCYTAAKMFYNPPLKKAE